MSAPEQIESYISAQDAPKREDLRTLHRLILDAQPGCKLWFNDGKNADGKVVANPNIGYGGYTIHYADGSSREFYRIGLSGNKIGISDYVLGLEDKTILASKFGKDIGKATVTGYCIKFKNLAAIDIDVLMAAVAYGLDS